MYSELRQPVSFQVYPLVLQRENAITDLINSNSMSHEFYQIMVGAPTMSLYSWKQLARWSLDYSCLSDKEIRQGHKILAKDWKLFCEWVKEEYGEIVVGGEVDEAKAQEKEKYKSRKDLS
jgi:adenosine deaminase CECR1